MRRPAQRQRGFSLVELMVSVVVGLLALMFATRLMLSAESNRQASLGGSDAMQNGMQALFSISGDAGQAGWGLNDPLLTGCNTVFSDSGGYALASAARGAATVTPLAAAVIVSNGANPDQLSLYSGSSMSGIGTLRLTADYTNGNSLTVDRVPYGFSLGEVIVVAPETIGGNCALAQIAANPALQPVLPNPQRLSIVAGANFRFNSGALGAAYKNGQARLFNLGPGSTLSLHTWSVNIGVLHLRAANLVGAGQTAASVTDNVVSLKAQYGFNTGSGQVGRWSASMIDADGNGVVGSAADYQAVVALRLAIVARSKNPEKPGASGQCSATTVKPTVFASEQPSGTTAVPMEVNVAVTNDPIDWKCYRYRVFETIVPLRNAVWRPT